MNEYMPFQGLSWTSIVTAADKVDVETAFDNLEDLGEPNGRGPDSQLIEDIVTKAFIADNLPEVVGLKEGLYFALQDEIGEEVHGRILGYAAARTDVQSEADIPGAVKRIMSNYAELSEYLADENIEMHKDAKFLLSTYEPGTGIRGEFNYGENVSEHVVDKFAQNKDAIQSAIEDTKLNVPLDSELDLYSALFVLERKIPVTKQGFSDAVSDIQDVFSGNSYQPVEATTHFLTGLNGNEAYSGIQTLKVTEEEMQRNGHYDAFNQNFSIADKCYTASRLPSDILLNRL